MARRDSKFCPEGDSGALMDYRLQRYVVPESEQILKQWEAIWWDPDTVIPIL